MLRRKNKNKNKKSGKKSILIKTGLVNLLRILSICLLIYVVVTLMAVAIIPAIVAYFGGAVGVKLDMDWRIITSAWLAPTLFIVGLALTLTIWFFNISIGFINKKCNNLINKIKQPFSDNNKEQSVFNSIFTH